MFEKRLPHYIVSIANNGYLVGGAVRDLLLNRKPQDFDLVVDDNPGDMATKLAEATSGSHFEFGKGQFTIHRVVYRSGTIDVSLLKNGDLEHDLGMRDFTINAMAISLEDGRLVDLYNGKGDLESGVIRLVSQNGFSQDPVRLLRAHRLSADLGFIIDTDTSQGIRQSAPLIQSSPGERIWSELQLIMDTKDSSAQLMEMAENGLLAAIIPRGRTNEATIGQNVTEARSFAHCLAAYDRLERLLDNPGQFDLPADLKGILRGLPNRERLLAKFAVLIHDTHQLCHYPGREMRIQPGVMDDGRYDRDSMRICHRLRLSSRDSRWVSFIIRHREHPLVMFHSPEIMRPGRFYRQCGVFSPHILIQALAELPLRDETISHESSYFKTFLIKKLMYYFNIVEGILKCPSLVSGEDLLRHFELKPSPVIGRLLSHIMEARLENRITYAHQAMDIAGAYLRKNNRLQST